VRKGWIRALKGRVVDLSTLVFKGDEPLKISFFAETISKIPVVADVSQTYLAAYRAP
jgi:topoisomerase-4 subunit A